MNRQSHIQTPGLIYTPECYSHPATKCLTWQAVCRCGKVIRGKTRTQLTINQKAHYTRCTRRTYHAT